LSAIRLQTESPFQTFQLRNSGILEFVIAVTCAGFQGMHREVERVGGNMRCEESSEAYRREFAPKNEAVTPTKTIPWQRFAATAKT
jgi:hypothetical protein